VKRVAVLLSGHLRTFEKTYDSWDKEVFSRVYNEDRWSSGSFEAYDVDLFLNVWDVVGTRLDPVKDDKIVEEDLTPMKFTAEQLKQKYNAVAVNIESYDGMHDTFLTSSLPVRSWKNVDPRQQDIRVVHLYSMWYMVAKCYDMMDNYARENDIQYDAVIKARPDLRINRFEMPESMDFVNMPWYHRQDEPHDWIAVGSPEMMRKYCHLYNHLDGLWEASLVDVPESVLKHIGTHLNWTPPQGKDSDRFLNPHMLLFYHLMYRNVSVRRWLKDQIRVKVWRRDSSDEKPRSLQEIFPAPHDARKGRIKRGNPSKRYHKP
jgi:hypothetical protein